MFEEASWTLKIEARGKYPIALCDGVPALGRTKNRFNFDFGCSRRVAWTHLGAVLEAPGGVLEACGSVLEALGGVLEALEGVLKASWRL